MVSLGDLKKLNIALTLGFPGAFKMPIILDAPNRSFPIIGKDLELMQYVFIRKMSSTIAKTN